MNAVLNTKNSMDILIKNSRLREKQYDVHIGISKGLVASIIPSNSDYKTDMEANSLSIIDAHSSLVTPSFIEPHIKSVQLPVKLFSYHLTLL